MKIEIQAGNVPSFFNIDAVRDAQQAKQRQEEADLYFRDGSRSLFDLERHVAGILGVKEGSLLLYASGMSAVVDALEILRPTVGTKIVKAYQHYSQTGGYITDELRARGALVYDVDSGSQDSVNRAVQQRRPDIVCFETVTNGSEMAVLDVRSFLRGLGDLDPLVILDNTLPSSTGLPLGQVLEDSGKRIIGVESGTKFLGLNTETSGIAYTANRDLLTALRKRRQRTGSLLSLSAVETIRGCMPRCADEYNNRNQAIFRHTLRLARACSNSQDLDKFIVVHPNLPDHSNSDLANSIAPDGISPVFFINPTSFYPDHYEIAARLWGDPTISSLCDLGQSFGFDRTRIWPDDNTSVVRISGGVYSALEEALLDNAFHKVLSS